MESNRRTFAQAKPAEQAQQEKDKKGGGREKATTNTRHTLCMGKENDFVGEVNVKRT